MAMDLVTLARRTIGHLDLTNLEDDPSDADIERLCANTTSRWGTVAAVCVWPGFVARCKELLAGSGVLVATVINFPAGDNDVAAALAEAEKAAVAGADEFDVVIPYRAFLAGDTGAVGAMVAGVKRACGGRTVKAILETGELPDQHMVMRAAELAVGAGADFLKTSTGKSPVSATPEAAFTMLEVIKAHNRPVGLKVAGGIRTLEQAKVYFNLADDIMGEGWTTKQTFRFGASSLLDAAWAALGAPPGG